MSKRWYVVHAYSGFEKSVQRALIERVARNGMQDAFGRILVPVEEVVELRSGQKSISERKFFPGYVLVEMEMNDESWHLVKSTPKVTGFVGGTANKPTPISEKEVEKIMQQMQDGVEKPRPKVLFEPGEVVRVKEGPFTDFHGSVEHVNYEKSRLRVSVTIFGRSTPVELEFGQVLVPVEEVVELKLGQKSISERKFFPGYVLVEMEMNDESWHLVKSTPKVTGFVGGTANKPSPISEKEVAKIMQQMQDGVEKPRPKVLFEPGEVVRVKEGPFTDFHGSVEDVNYEKNRLRVSVTIFGRATPVELDFAQVEKA